MVSTHSASQKLQKNENSKPKRVSTMGKLRTPGPGSYDLPARFTIEGRMRGGRPTASFASNSRRATKASDNKGGRGPGGYDIEKSGVSLGNKEPMWARTTRSFNREVNSGRSSFNSRSERERASSASPKSTRGGPGENDFSHMYTCGSSASTQVTSSFLSSMPLGGHVRRSDSPGVGSYDPHNVENLSGSRGSRQGTSAFAGSNNGRGRTDKRSATGDGVGPGSYEFDQSSISNKLAASINPRLPAFNSAALRYSADKD